jgi:hypothetical protein
MMGRKVTLVLRKFPNSLGPGKPQNTDGLSQFRPAGKLNASARSAPIDVGTKKLTFYESIKIKATSKLRSLRKCVAICSQIGQLTRHTSQSPQHLSVWRTPRVGVFPGKLARPMKFSPGGICPSVKTF